MRMTQIAAFLLPLVFSCVSLASTPAQTTQPIDQKAVLANAPKLNPQALKIAVDGYEWALKRGQVKNSTVLTVIDFDMPAYAKRMWVIDLKDNKVLMNLYTTQGKGSGLVYAKRFSNQFNTDETSLGVYTTAYTYHGEHGFSMRLNGLEKGVNNNAMRRDIVVHPAWYATPGFVTRYHRTGRSWGCFAIDPAVSARFIDLTKGGSVIFAYAKQEDHDKIIS